MDYSSDLHEYSLQDVGGRAAVHDGVVKVIHWRIDVRHNVDLHG